MTDIVIRLRNPANMSRIQVESCMWDAADEIERLSAVTDVPHDESGWRERGPYWRDRATAAEARLAEAVKVIGMQDIRLHAGEGKLDVHTVLQAVNAVLRARFHRVGEVKV